MSDADFRAFIEGVLLCREDMRAVKDYQSADVVRDVLAESGILIEDTTSGPRWRRR